MMNVTRGRRLYIISGRMRRHPKSYLTCDRAYAYPNQLTPYYTARACSRHWRRGRYPGESRDAAKREKVQEQEDGPVRSSACDHNYPFEPSRRERMWRERMDRFRKLVDNDPYEAIFGYSNRLLQGVRQDWSIDHQKWWRKDVNHTVNEPWAGKKVEIEGDKHQDQRTPSDNDIVDTAKAKVTHIQMEAELEYDPISNRMVPKFSQTLIDHNHAAGNDPIDVTNREAKVTASSPADSQATPPKRDHQVERRTPSFTMLKEDLVEESVLPSERGKMKPTTHDATQTDSAREEYEQYKARRFGGASSSETWLAQKDFPSDNASEKMNSSLEEKFDALHAQKEAVVPDFKSQKLQKPEKDLSHRVVHSEHGKEFGGGASNDILQYHKEVMAANLKNKRMNEESVAKDAIMIYNRQVAKTNLKSQQLVKLMELKNKIQIITSELKAVTQLAANVEQMSLAVPEPAKDVQLARLDTDQALKSVTKSAATLETSLQRYMEKTASAPMPLQTSLQRMRGRDGRTASAVESVIEASEQVRTHDPVGYNHARESKRVQQLENATSKSRPFRVPSLAEVFGYTKSTAEASKQSIAADGADASSKILHDEVSKHKNAYQAFESTRKDQTTTTTRARSDTSEQSSSAANEAAALRALAENMRKTRDAALVTEIKQIYEDKYGAITTEHRQPTHVLETTQTVVAPLIQSAETRSAEDVFLPQYAELPEQPSARESRAAASTAQVGADKAVESAKEATEEMPMSTLKSPIPSKTAKYMILSYDSKMMTTASFESIPASTETIIPLTVALTHLQHAGRFLPKLKELRKAGYVPVHADRSLLIMRQDETSLMGPHSIDTVQQETVEQVPTKDSSLTRKFKPRKMEPVFSGAPRMDNKIFERTWREYKESRRVRRRRKMRRNVKFLAGGVVLAGAVIYIAGVGAEVRTGRKMVARRDVYNAGED